VALDAIEYIKKLGHIEQFATSLDYFGVDLDEGWESGPEEYEEPYDDADDAYDRQRQEKIDTEAEKEWAKLPKVSTYQCIGRGANMEPNQKFGPEFDTLEKALEYRAEIMKDPKTPHPEHIGINTLTRVVDKEQTDEAIDSDIVQPMGQDSFNRGGFNPIRDQTDYLKRRSVAWNLLNASNFGIPQSRERIYIVAFRKDLNIKEFSFPKPINKSVSLIDFLLPEESTKELIINRKDIFLENNKKIQKDMFGGYPQ
jgi:hypothetical protein